MERYLYQDLYQLERSHFWHISKRKTVISLLKKFLKTRSPKILDYGCGTGENLLALSKLGESFGVDNSSDAIDFCKQKGIKNVTLVKNDKLPYKNSQFNLVTMLDVLEHIDEKGSLKEVKRVLSDDGLVLITVPAFMWLWSKWDEVLHHKRRYTTDSLKAVLNKNGFEVIKISYMYSFLVIPALITRLIKSVLFKGEYPSDFKLSTPLINKLLLKVASVERWFILKLSVPIGTSIICVAKKR
jgi:ubiquinone/menaquinone biosynthesis C-methylase UbiE